MENLFYRILVFWVVSQCVLALTLPAPGCTSNSAAMSLFNILRFLSILRQKAHEAELTMGGHIIQNQRPKELDVTLNGDFGYCIEICSTDSFRTFF